MKRNSLFKNVPIHETLYIGLSLGFVGGFLDAYTYLLRGGVFANAQTGNLVLLSIHMAQGEFPEGLVYLAPIAAFLFGVLATELVKRKFSPKRLVEWQHIILIAEICLLFGIGFLPQTVPNALVNILISFVCSMQFNGFRTTRGLPYASTMCTGNLRSAGEFLFLYLDTKEREAGKKALRYFGVIVLFLMGAAAGTFLCGGAGVSAVWVCCAVLLAVLFIMLFGK